MKFSLFSEIFFEVSTPITLIESYCFQSDFYGNYDLPNYHETARKIENVNNIGARIGEETLKNCKNVTQNTNTLTMFAYNLDRFLDLDDKVRNDYIKELNEKAIKKLLIIPGIGLSKATKILHTLYPEIIPIIDRTLQEAYISIERCWTKEQSDQILIDYYDNLKKDHNRKNLDDIFQQVRSINLLGLTKVRIFDILWWSYLKSRRLREKNNINWSTVV